MSGASRSQRQAVGGTSQEKSDVKHGDPKKRKGMEKIASTSDKESPVHSNHPLERLQKNSPFAEIDIGQTRATMDQQKREK